MPDSYKLVTEYPVEKYNCGLTSGQKIKLIQDIVVRDHNDIPTGEVIPAGEIWTVLSGSDSKPIVVWLKQANGEIHTWDDDKTIFDFFEVVGSS
jgi:hypothetical protein